jgi:DNA-binding response OmpR family regulator/Flp pilus assembly protein TadD
MHSPAMSKLLLVDADPLSLRVLDVSLRKAGFDVVTASDREGALAKLGTGVPDLLVTDTRLREGDGFALVKALREREGAADLPVIFLSTAESPEEREQAGALGVDYILGKPVFVRELLARAQLLLARRAQRSVASGPVSGTTRELALVDLLQGLEASHTTGVVALEHEGETARIYLRDGNVVDAELGRTRGAEVVFRALGWDQASFRVQPGPVDNDDLLECTTHALLLRAMDRLDGLTPEPSSVLVTELAPTPASRPTETTEAPAPPALDTRPGASARERSVPSTAPWTREAEPSAAPTHEVDLRAAGVPGARTRTVRRAGLLAAAAGAALVVVIGLRSVHNRQLQESESARAQLPTTSAAAAAAGPSQPLEPGASLVTATAPVAEEVNAAPATADTTPATDTATSPDGLPVTAPGASSTAPAVDPRETALDVKTALHARSALVRDAQAALLKGDTGKAMTLAQQATATSPYDAEGWLTLAAARKAAGDLGGARDAYTQCVAKAHTVGVMSCRALAVRGE